MTTYIIDTQGMENYGAHSEDGKFSNNNHYWKFKGGSSYKVTGLDRPQDAMAFIAAIGMENGIGWKEWPCEFKTLEEWEQQWDMHCPHDREYREFSLKRLIEVNPATYNRKAS